MIGEDIVLTWGMLERGGRTTFEPSAIAFTDVPDTVRGFLRQRQRWARGMIEGSAITAAGCSPATACSRTRSPRTSCSRCST